MTTERNVPARIGRLKRDLAEAKTMTEFRGVEARAKVIMQLTKGMTEALDLHNEAAIVAITAIRRWGDALSKMAKARGGGDQKSDHRFAARKGDPSGNHTYEELRIKPTKAWEGQRIAAIPEATLQAYYVEAKAAEEEITIAGARRLAAPEPDFPDLIPPKVTPIKTPARTLTLHIETAPQESQVGMVRIVREDVERVGPMIKYEFPPEQERPPVRTFHGPKATTPDQWRAIEMLKSLCDAGWLGERISDFSYAARTVLDSSDEAQSGVQACIDGVLKLQRAIKAERSRRGG